MLQRASSCWILSLCTLHSENVCDTAGITGFVLTLRYLHSANWQHNSLARCCSAEDTVMYQQLTNPSTDFLYDSWCYWVKTHCGRIIVPGWYTKTYLAGRPEAQTKQSSSAKPQNGWKCKQILTLWKLLQSKPEAEAIAPAAETHLQLVISQISAIWGICQRAELSVSISATTLWSFPRGPLSKNNRLLPRLTTGFYKLFFFL